MAAIQITAAITEVNSGSEKTLRAPQPSGMHLYSLTLAFLRGRICMEHATTERKLKGKSPMHHCLSDMHHQHPQQLATYLVGHITKHLSIVPQKEYDLPG